jgi:hypothetical protein
LTLTIETADAEERRKRRARSSTSGFRLPNLPALSVARGARREIWAGLKKLVAYGGVRSPCPVTVSQDK